MPFFAHSANPAAQWEPLAKHLTATAELAARFAAHFGERGRAWRAGLLHDLGKYGGLFQDVLHARETRIDHWSPGAWAGDRLPRPSVDRAACPQSSRMPAHTTMLPRGGSSAPCLLPS
ncbi:MAG: HD domain-containing protein [Acidobacteria bacterium]|nr:HD domain-containing protein [Acidobacteriota bacterium]